MRDTESQLSFRYFLPHLLLKKKKENRVFKFQASWKQFSMVLLLAKFLCIIPKETALRRHFWRTADDTTSVNFLVTSRWAFVWQQDV